MTLQRKTALFGAALACLATIAPGLFSASSAAAPPTPDLAPPHESRPIADAADATARALAAANRAAQEQYSARPFARARSKAVFDGAHWVWRQCAGYGTGDLEVSVRLTPNGAVAEVTFAQLTSIGLR